jgi:excisionase family DNA binding protein
MTKVRLHPAAANGDTPPCSQPHFTLGFTGGPDEPSGWDARTRERASMAINEIGPMLTATEVADMLHLHVNTVKRLGDRGELPFYRVCKRGDRRFRLDDVMKFLSRDR